MWFDLLWFDPLRLCFDVLWFDPLWLWLDVLWFELLWIELRRVTLLQRDNARRRRKSCTCSGQAVCGAGTGARR